VFRQRFAFLFCHLRTHRRRGDSHRPLHAAVGIGGNERRRRVAGDGCGVIDSSDVSPIGQSSMKLGGFKLSSRAVVAFVICFVVIALTAQEVYKAKQNAWREARDLELLEDAKRQLVK
jgi:hypothetical protein